MRNESEGQRLISEPVTRPDGRVVSVWEVKGYPPYASDTIQFRLTGSNCSYTREELMKLGGEDSEEGYQLGINKVARALYQIPFWDLLPGNPRLFREELDMPSSTSEF